MTARPIVRRVKDLSSKAAAGQGELFTAWRYHAIFTDSPFETIRAEEQHRGHVQAEQVFAGWTDGPLAHLPSGSFPANATWLALAAISCNLLRRRRHLGQPRLRQSPRRHPTRRPHQCRRPHRPPRPRPSHRAPAPKAGTASTSG